MKFHYEDKELDIYRDEDEHDFPAATLFQNIRKGITLSLGEGFTLKENDDGYGNTIYSIEKT